MINNRFKFRAWDHTNEHIADFNRYGKPEDFWMMAIAHDWEIMQCTGLEDKNDKLIYEGDIVRILYTDWISQSRDDERTLDQYKEDISSIGKVCFIGCSWRIVFWNSKYKEWNPSSIYEGRHGEKTIIGNIYENPELLNNE